MHQQASKNPLGTGQRHQHQSKSDRAQLVHVRTPDDEVQEGGYVNRGDLPYDYEDLGLSRDGLASKFSEANEHEFYIRKDWQTAINEGHTMMGYWEWVESSIKADDEDF